MYNVGGQLFAILQGDKIGYPQRQTMGRAFVLAPYELVFWGGTLPTLVISANTPSFSSSWNSHFLENGLWTGPMVASTFYDHDFYRPLGSGGGGAGGGSITSAQKPTTTLKLGDPVPNPTYAPTVSKSGNINKKGGEYGFTRHKEAPPGQPREAKFHAG